MPMVWAAGGWEAGAAGSRGAAAGREAGFWGAQSLATTLLVCQSTSCWQHASSGPKGGGGAREAEIGLYGMSVLAFSCLL